MCLKKWWEPILLKTQMKHQPNKRRASIQMFLGWRDTAETLAFSFTLLFACQILFCHFSEINLVKEQKRRRVCHEAVFSLVVCPLLFSSLYLGVNGSVRGYWLLNNRGDPWRNRKRLGLVYVTSLSPSVGSDHFTPALLRP